jgi:hypothetical protein
VPSHFSPCYKGQMISRTARRGGPSHAGASSVEPTPRYSYDAIKTNMLILFSCEDFPRIALRP